MNADFRFAPTASRANVTARWRLAMLNAFVTWAIVAWASAAWASTSAPVAEEARAEAFSAIDLGAFVAIDTRSDAIHNSWEALPGLGLDLATPFYVGDLRFLLQYSPLEGKPPSLPDFDAWISTLGWGLGAALPLRMEAGLGASFGNYLMVFSGEDLAPGAKVESEFCAGARLSLDWRLCPRWRLGAEMSALQVFTATPLRLWFFRAAIHRRFDAPLGWREFWR